MLKFFFADSSICLKFEWNDPLISLKTEKSANKAITAQRQLLNLPSICFEEVGLHVVHGALIIDFDKSNSLRKDVEENKVHSNNNITINGQ